LDLAIDKAKGLEGIDKKMGCLIIPEINSTELSFREIWGPDLLEIATNALNTLIRFTENHKKDTM